MGDRSAFSNPGRIEETGSPIDVYEHPATEFVAGFVGVSNLLERGGRRVTVRPEKIRILEEQENTQAGDELEHGVIRDAVYVGSVTRYIVDLAAGGTLTVVRQNLEGFGGDADENRGLRVQLAWRPEHTYVIERGETEEDE